MLFRRSKMQNKEAASWGVALNQSLGLESTGNIPDEADLSDLKFVYNLNNPFSYMQNDLKSNVVSGSTNLVGNNYQSFGMVGVGSGAWTLDPIINMGPNSQQGIVNARITCAAIVITLNAAGVAAMVGKTVRVLWTENIAAAGLDYTWAFTDIVSPGLNNFVSLIQLLGFNPMLPYPRTLVVTIRVLDGTNWPAATTLRRECSIIQRPLKLPLPI